MFSHIYLFLSKKAKEEKTKNKKGPTMVYVTVDNSFLWFLGSMDHMIWVLYLDPMVLLHAFFLCFILWKIVFCLILSHF